MVKRKIQMAFHLYMICRQLMDILKEQLGNNEVQNPTDQQCYCYII